MRLWTLHPTYLDAKGLVALWREGLLAQAVLRGETKGYRNHPQLARFRELANPSGAVATYLHAVHAESLARGYRFDLSKLGPIQMGLSIEATSDQLTFEWQHLLHKLSVRDVETFRRFKDVPLPEPHPIFTLAPGPLADWERGASA